MKNIIASIFAAATLMIATPSYALFSPLAASQVDTSKWQAQYVGETEIDGMRVVALLESIVQEISIPELISSKSLLPTSAANDTPRAWRLTLVSIEQPELRASFALNRDKAFVDGSLTNVYFSKNVSASGFSFVIQSTNDGRLHVQYSQNVANDGVLSGEFQMIPAVQVM